MHLVKPRQEEMISIQKILTDLAEYYSTKLTPRQMEMYTEDLLDLGSDNVLKSSLTYRRNLTSDSFPLPSKLRRQLYLCP